MRVRLTDPLEIAKDESRCEHCGRFLAYEDNSYLSEGGWCEDEGYLACSNPKCQEKIKPAEGK